MQVPFVTIVPQTSGIAALGSWSVPEIRLWTASETTKP